MSNKYFAAKQFSEITYETWFLQEVFEWYSFTLHCLLTRSMSCPKMKVVSG